MKARKAKGWKGAKRLPKLWLPAKGQTIGKSKYKPVGEEFYDNWR